MIKLEEFSNAFYNEDNYNELVEHELMYTDHKHEVTISMEVGDNKITAIIYDFYEKNKTCTVEMIFEYHGKYNSFSMYEVDEDKVFDMIVDLYKNFS